MPKIKTDTPKSTNARKINLLIMKVVKIASQHFRSGRRELPLHGLDECYPIESNSIGSYLLFVIGLWIKRNEFCFYMVPMIELYNQADIQFQ